MSKDDDNTYSPDKNFQNKNVAYIIPGEGCQLTFQLDDASKKEDRTSQNYIMALEYADGYKEELGLIYSEFQVEKLAYFLAGAVGSEVQVRS